MLGSQASSFSDMKISSDLMRIEMREIIVNTKNKIIQIDEINTANKVRKQEIERKREIERENEIMNEIKNEKEEKEKDEDIDPKLFENLKNRLNQLESTLLNQEKEVEKEVVSEENKNKIDADILSQNKEVLEELKVVQNKLFSLEENGKECSAYNNIEEPSPVKMSDTKIQTEKNKIIKNIQNNVEDLSKISKKIEKIEMDTNLSENVELENSKNIQKNSEKISMSQSTVVENKKKLSEKNEKISFLESMVQGLSDRILNSERNDYENLQNEKKKSEDISTLNEKEIGRASCRERVLWYV